MDRGAGPKIELGVAASPAPGSSPWWRMGAAKRKRDSNFDGALLMAMHWTRRMDRIAWGRRTQRATTDVWRGQGLGLGRALTLTLTLGLGLGLGLVGSWSSIAAARPASTVGPTEVLDAVTAAGAEAEESAQAEERAQADDDPAGEEWYGPGEWLGDRHPPYMVDFERHEAAYDAYWDGYYDGYYDEAFGFDTWDRRWSDAYRTMYSDGYTDGYYDNVSG